MTELQDGERPELTPDVTPEIISVMCEPVRWRSYGLLHGLGPLRAAQLARKVSISEASMLKHLGIMADIGFAWGDPESASTPRHRQWYAVPGALRLTGLEDSADPAYMRRWMQVFVQSQNLALRQWVQEEDAWPLAWRESSLNYDYWMHLTRDELTEFTQELHAVTQKWDAFSRARTLESGQVEGAEAIYVSTNAFPVKD